MSQQKTFGSKPESAFAASGFQATVATLQEEISALYVSDDIPWIIGYSGGKDSTATLQLVWSALVMIPKEKRSKPVYVISTDTLVENPIVSAWVAGSLENMRRAAHEQAIPVEPHLLHPRTEDSFWVNLIGKGYPAPRPKFRWCTERLKIRPSNRFISDVVGKNGEAILCLGARKSESQARAKVFERNEKFRVRDRLSPSPELAGCSIYTPVEAWTNDDIWLYLNNCKNPWGASNKELMSLYAGASADGECPLVVDTSTPSCGSSRFGCWVCTLVEKDKSMSAMIQNDADKEWLMPLLDLRNSLDFRGKDDGNEDSSDHQLRDFRRMSGAITLMADGRPIPGPYTQQSRATWLTKLLEAQAHVRAMGPSDVRNIELITIAELEEIRRIWVLEKHELEDLLPAIYEKCVGCEYPGNPLDDNAVFRSEDMKILEELCGTDRLHYELSRELISITHQQRNSARRTGLFDQLEKSFSKNFFESPDEAVNRANSISAKRKSIEGELAGAAGEVGQVSPTQSPQ